MIATLLILGGTVFGVLGALHALYTLLDLRNPRRLVPVDPSVAQAMGLLRWLCVMHDLLFDVKRRTSP